MSPSRSAPSRALPDRPSLEQLRKQAKELLKSYRTGDPSATQEVQRYDWRPDPATFALADAQRILARSYGFPSWMALKQRVDVIQNCDAYIKAVKSGDGATVRKLVTATPALLQKWRPDAAAPTALHYAVVHRDVAMTRALMQLGCDAGVGVWPHRPATTPSIIAKERQYDEITAAIEAEEMHRRQKLSSPGAAISPQTDEIHKAIRDGRSEDAIRILESDLSLIGACDVHGATPLHIAAWKHDPQMVAWLLDHGAPVNAHQGVTRLSNAPCDEGPGKTPLDYASIVAGWSAHGRDFAFLENSHLDPARFEETAQLLLDRGAELTPRAAVALGDKQAVQRMYAAKKLPNEIHTYRGGLLAIAARVNRIDMLSLLLDLGLDPDEWTTEDERESSWGMPLWFCAMCGRREMAELLLKRGADVNAIVYACGDAMSIAERTQDQEFIALLLKHGARLTVEHVAGRGDRETAQANLDGRIAAQSLNVRQPTPTDLAEQMLWAAGGSDPEIVRMCLPHMTRKQDDPWWNYVLLSATLPESVRLILEHGVDPSVAGSGGYTMLHHLASIETSEQPQSWQMTEPTRLTLIKLFLDAGARLDLRDPLLKSTPLGWACRWGRKPLVEIFLARGADAVEPDAEPWATPLSWATQGGHQEIAELLRNRGAVTPSQPGLANS